MLALVMTLCLALAQVGAQEPDLALEYKFKAGYLFNLAKFIEWPDAASVDTNAFIVGVMGSADATSAIENTLRGKMVDKRTFVVKQITSSSPIPACHILFVSRDIGKSPAEVRQALGAAPTLLIGDAEQFAENGGMVGFERQGNAFYLKLNLGEATHAGLKVSAKLANVARLVKTREEN